MKICLHSGNSLIDHAIRFQTRSRYSHVSMLFADGEVWESVPGIGVRRKLDLQPAKGESIDICSFTHSLYQEAQVKAFFETQDGKPYDYLGVLRFITRTPVKHWEKKSWFCSEIAYYGLDLAGIQFLRATPAWKVSPELISLSPLILDVRTIRG